MSISYEVIIEPFAEKHFIKTFAKKYKGAWDVTRFALTREFQSFDVIVEKSPRRIFLSCGGFYIFDEPEAALSPQRQLALLRVIHDLSKHPESQFIIATHSPILLAYPGATIYSCDGDTLDKVEYHDTKHYQITKAFLENPTQYFKHLFS